MSRLRVIDDPDPLLMPHEAAHLLGVGVKSVGRWRRAGLLESVKLPGGGHRYRTSVVEAILNTPGDPRVDG
jgi:predicted site-specific integrase-resolvase